MAKKNVKEIIQPSIKKWYKDPKYIVSIILAIITSIIAPLILKQKSSTNYNINSLEHSQAVQNVNSGNGTQNNYTKNDDSKIIFTDKRKTTNFFITQNTPIRPKVVFNGNGRFPGLAEGNSFDYGKDKIAFIDIIENLGNSSAINVQEELFQVDWLDSLHYRLTPFSVNDNISEIKAGLGYTFIHPTDHDYPDTAIFFIKINYTDESKKKYATIRKLLFMPTFTVNTELPDCPERYLKRIKPFLMDKHLW
jgi:hypothetical protein